MTLSEATGEVERFRKSPWKFQQTFRTPLNDLPRFVAAILSAFPLQKGSLVIEQVVFEPKHLLDLLASRSIPAQQCQNVIVTAVNDEEVAALLEAALGDWVDFLFAPIPDPFAIYADHDEYTTFFANSGANLNRMTAALNSAGFKMVPDYTRSL